MLGQLWVAPEPDPEPEPDPDELLDDPEPVLLVPEVPVLELGAVVEELVPEPEPELPVVVEVVAALATNAPPARSPELRAPMARTLRKRSCMGVMPFRLGEAPARPGRYSTRCATDLGAGAERRGRVGGIT